MAPMTGGVSGWWLGSLLRGCLGAECHECRMRADVPECAVSMRYA
jgi:hypothetical protein